MWFNDWASLYRIVLISFFSYVALVLLLRVSGKRTLSKMNAFDLVVTVALGSTLSSIILDQSISLAEGVLALAMLIALQFIVAWTSVRSPEISRIVKSDPVLLVYQKRLLPSNLRAERVTEEEVTSAIRASGLHSIEDAEAVVLETEGSFSVIKRSERPSESLSGVRRKAS